MWLGAGDAGAYGTVGRPIAGHEVRSLPSSTPVTPLCFYIVTLPWSCKAEAGPQRRAITIDRAHH